MSARANRGGASPTRFALVDWISLAVFALPLIGAAIHGVAGGGQ